MEIILSLDHARHIGQHQPRECCALLCDRQLTEAAQLGEHEAAEACLVAMLDAGYEASSHMFHGIIFSYAKAGISDAAVRCFYACLDRGG